MNLAKIIFASLSIYPLSFHDSIALADETFVICSDNNKNWNWLENGKVTVSGSWKNGSVQSVHYYKFFILDEGIAKYNALKAQCLSEFGSDFIYPQPSDSYFSNWAPFAHNGDEILDGFITYIYIDFRIRQGTRG